MLPVVFKYVREGYKEEMDFNCGWIKGTVVFFFNCSKRYSYSIQEKTSTCKET